MSDVSSSQTILGFNILHFCGTAGGYCHSGQKSFTQKSIMTYLNRSLCLQMFACWGTGQINLDKELIADISDIN